MISFFRTPSQSVIAVESAEILQPQSIDKLRWLFGEARVLDTTTLQLPFVGPRREMVTPWSTCAVEITQNMGISGITRIEEFTPIIENSAYEFDPMLQHKYEQLDQNLFSIDRVPESIIYIDDIAAYNDAEGLALNEDEIRYLEDVIKMERKLTDSEVLVFRRLIRNIVVTKYSMVDLLSTGKRKNSRFSIN